jgi:carboxyl-terminal processing protease
MRGLVLDLRDNPGGPLDQPIRVTRRFLPRGDLVVYLRGRAPKSDQDYRAVDREFIKLPLVVLVNGVTAAASEIVAGALQDHGRATIVGTQTAGSGSTQSVYRVANGARLLLTTARWFTPKNRSIRPGAGLKPDITVPDPACDERGPSDQSDPQLQRALEVITGLIGR